MKRVTGIGGIFFKAENLKETRAWYKKHLGINSGEYGGMFEWRHAKHPEQKGFTAWSPFSADTDYFDPADKEFMINYRVDDLENLMQILRKEGVEIVGEIQEFNYGKFGWIMDPNGQKIELWEPNDKIYESMGEQQARNPSS